MGMAQPPPLQCMQVAIPLSQDQPLPEHPAETPLTLTVNARLARWLLLEHDEQRRKSGDKAWQTPSILSFSSWLKNLWLESWPLKYVLTELQSAKIWEGIIEQDSKELGLLHLQGVAYQARQAFSLIHEYRLPRDAKLYEQTEEAKALLRWVKKYERRLNLLGALDSCMLIDAVRSSMQDEMISIPPALRVMGFEEQNPQLKYFLNFLAQKGTHIEFLSTVPEPQILTDKLGSENSTVSVLEYEQRQGEAEACARWVRTLFQPGKRIGIVVPELEKYGSLLKREFTAELVPGNIFNQDEQDLPFNISLAPPLSQEPMIKMALNLLSVKTASIPVGIFMSTLHSPFFGFEFPPKQEVSDLEYKLRRKRFLSLPSDPMKALGGSSLKIIKLAEDLKSWAVNNKKILPSQWAEELSDFLKTSGWPGSQVNSTGDNKQSLLSKRHQAFEAWKDCLNQLCSLNQILGAISRREALNHLNQIARNQPFQIKTPEHSIQIIGLLESSGMQFDHLWVMGCHNETLPAHPEPNSFIPYEIRTKYSIPRSTPQRELKFAEQSLSRLLMSAPEVLFSYPLHEGDMDREISPLLKRFKQSKLKFPLSNRIKDQIQTLNQLETFTEPTDLPVTDTEKNRFATQGISSGYGLIKDQVDCPFRAFTRHRLKCERNPTPEIDFDNMDRGNLIHKALELFWARTKDLKNLLKIAQNNTLEKCIELCVQEALPICCKRTVGQTQFNNIEIERNIRILLDWLLNVELKRADFTVLHNEEDLTINLSGLKLSLRIDRIDEVHGTGLLLIDYKTGREAKPAEWFAEKIRAPQLPLYALAKPPAGLAYAHILLGKPELKGTSVPEFPCEGFKNKDFTKSKVFSEWGELLDYWKNNLNLVAQDFLQGNHQVSPISKDDPCRHCDFSSFCRIQEIENFENLEDRP